MDWQYADWQYIEEKYGFKIIDKEKVRKVYKLYTDKGLKCFKRAHARKSYFLFVFSAVDHLIHNGFNAPIAYERTLDNDICIEDGEYIYYVLPWIECRQCKFKKNEDLIKAIKLSAEFHKAASGLKIPDGSQPRIYYGKWPENFEKRLDEIKLFKSIIETKKIQDAFDEVFYPLIDFHLNQGYEAIDLLKNSSYQSISEKARERSEFCHHDMAEHNFLITPTGEMRIIDFDYCIMDTRLHDVASLVIRNMKHGIWDISKAYFILNEYSKHYPIDDEGLKVIKYFTVFPQDFWQVGLQYYVEKQPWAMENFMSRLNRVKDDYKLREAFLKEYLAL